MVLNKKNPKVLAIGAHPDDIEIGAGGFISLLANRHKGHVEFLVLTKGVQKEAQDFISDSSRRASEAKDAAKNLGIPAENITVLDFIDCKLHEFGHEIIRQIETILYDSDGNSKFDIVLTHAAEDTHEDHRVTLEATLSAVRHFHGTVLCYQSPTTKPNGFRPTFFVELDSDAIAKKTLALQAHNSQRFKPFMQAHKTLGLAVNWAQFHRLPEDTYLEAFEIYKSFF